MEVEYNKHCKIFYLSKNLLFWTIWWKIPLPTNHYVCMKKNLYRFTRKFCISNEVFLIFYFLPLNQPKHTFWTQLILITWRNWLILQIVIFGVNKRNNIYVLNFVSHSFCNQQKSPLKYNDNSQLSNLTNCKVSLNKRINTCSFPRTRDTSNVIPESIRD